MINIFAADVDLFDLHYEIVPMADFESYKVFGAIDIRYKEYIHGTMVAVEPKFFNHVSFLQYGDDSIYNPVIIVNGQILHGIDLWTTTYRYKHEKYAVVSFNKILPQYRSAIIRKITGDNEIYTIGEKYDSFIKYHFFTEIVWRYSYNRSLYDGGYRIIPPDYVFDHFDEFSEYDKKRFNEVFRLGHINRNDIRNTIQKATYNDKLRFAKRYLKAIVKLKTQYAK